MKDSVMTTHSHRLLIDEPPLQVLPSLAVAVGLEKAIILQQLHYWTEAVDFDGRKRGKEREGFRWTYNAVHEWQRQFPFLSERSVKRHFQEMERADPPLLFSTDRFNEDRWDRTKWSRINYDALDALVAWPRPDDQETPDSSSDESAPLDGANLAHSMEPGWPTRRGQSGPLDGVSLARSLEETETNAKTNAETIPPIPQGGSDDHDDDLSAKHDEGDRDAPDVGAQPGNALLDRFDRWYAIYPRKVGKAAALKTWRRLKPNAELAAHMIAAVEAQRQGPDWTRDGGRYIPNPATWLNQGRWDDVVARPGGEQARPDPTRTPEGYPITANGFQPVAHLLNTALAPSPEQLARIRAGEPLRDVLDAEQFAEASAEHKRRAMMKQFFPSNFV